MYKFNQKKALNKALNEIISNNIDLELDKDSLIDLGNYIATHLGQEGFDQYRSIAERHSHFDKGTIQESFNNFLHSPQEVDPEPLYKTMVDAGCKSAILTNAIMAKDKTFDEDIYKSLPPFLQKFVSFNKSKTERDMLLLGAITVSSACFDKVSGYYNGEKLYPNLYTFILGPSASGKSTIQWASRLVEPIHKMKAETSPPLTSQLEQVIRRPGRPKIEKRPPKTFFIPGNSSSAGILELLSANGNIGLIFEPEADTIAEAFRKEFGNFSDLLRQASSHQIPRSYRKMDKNKIPTAGPKLSVLLSGTEGQLHNLIPSSENGLFSRFLYYYLLEKPEYKSPWLEAEPGQTERFVEECAKEFFDFYQSMQKIESLEFRLTENQQAQFDAFFAPLHASSIDLLGEETHSAIARIGTSAFRLAMTLSIFRLINGESPDDVLYCKDQDLETALRLSAKLVAHSLIAFASLPKGVITNHTSEDKASRVLDYLDDCFSTADILSKAEEFGFKKRSFERHISRFKKEGLIRRTEQGFYQKTIKVA